MFVYVSLVSLMRSAEIHQIFKMETNAKSTETIYHWIYTVNVMLLVLFIYLPKCHLSISGCRNLRKSNHFAINHILRLNLLPVLILYFDNRLSAQNPNVIQGIVAPFSIMNCTIAVSILNGKRFVHDTYFTRNLNQ